MVVRFRKTGRGRACAWEALRPPRTRVPGPVMAAGPDVPHDLATFVIEDALGIELGFWGCVAAGATFRSLGRKRTPQGTTVIREHVGELDAAEERVNREFFAWRAGETTEAGPALDAMLERWRALPDDGALEVEWPLSRRADRSARRSAPRRAPTDGGHRPGPPPDRPGAPPSGGRGSDPARRAR